jgi:hypothetical protein
MSNRKDLIARIMKNSKPKTIQEGRIQYDESHNERMDPTLERQLRERKTSLGDHPIFPASDETNFEEKIVSKRFTDVVNNVKRHFNCDEIDEGRIIGDMMEIVDSSVNLEADHKAELEALAETMIREEYDMSEEDVDITCELVPRGKVSLDGTRLGESPTSVDIEFETHKEIETANDEVHKRRFLNAMIQGAAKKNTHMYHMVDQELTNMNPRLVPMYNKMMSAADYMYYIKSDMENGEAGGIVKVTFPMNIGDRPKIHAQAYVFPVLIHELVKGVMELLASHGLSKNPKIRDYSIKKADYLQAEPWDMRIGPALWERFCNAMPSDNFNLKHHVFAEISSLPVSQFNHTMREIMAGTREGKMTVEKIVKEVKTDIDNDDYIAEMNQNRDTGLDDSTYGLDDINDIDLSDLGI